MVGKLSGENTEIVLSVGLNCSPSRLPCEYELLTFTHAPTPLTRLRLRRSVK